MDTHTHTHTHARTCCLFHRLFMQYKHTHTYIRMHIHTCPYSKCRTAKPYLEHAIHTHTHTHIYAHTHRPILEVLYRQAIPRTHACDSVNLHRFLINRLTKNPELLSKYAVNGTCSELNTHPGMHVFMYACACMYLHNVYMYACTELNTHPGMHVCMYVCVCMMYVYACMCTTYVCACVHMYANMYA
jgi:hypothetical protein